MEDRFDNVLKWANEYRSPRWNSGSMWWVYTLGAVIGVLLIYWLLTSLYASNSKVVDADDSSESTEYENDSGDEN